MYFGETPLEMEKTRTSLKTTADPSLIEMKCVRTTSKAMVTVIINVYHDGKCVSAEKHIKPSGFCVIKIRLIKLI